MSLTAAKSRALPGGAALRLLLLMLALSMALAARPLLAQTLQAQDQVLNEQLQAADDLNGRTQVRQRLDLLQKLQPRPGSPEQLEQIYLLATTLGHQVPESRWAQWQKDADPALHALGQRVQHLARLAITLNQRRYRDALEMLKPIDGIDELPARWRLREWSLRAHALEESGDPQAAQVLRLQSLPLLDATGTPWQQARGLMALAYNSGRLGDGERGLQWAQDAISRAEGLGPPVAQADLFNNLAIAYDTVGRKADARQALERALQLARPSGDQPLIALLIGNLSDAYLKAKQWQRALQLAEEAYQLGLRDPEGASAVSLALHNRGIAKIRLGQVQEGKADVRQSITLELQRGGSTGAAEGLAELGVALEQAGDLPGALQAYHEYRDLADRQTRIDRREALREAQAKADAARREREKALLIKQNALNAEALRSQRLGLILGALAIACGLALLALLVMLWRRLRTTNRLLSQTNRDLAQKSELDPLTGLGNRRRAERLLRGLEKGGGLEAGLVLLDIDHFKRINDNHGHAVGDQVLVAVAGRLRAALREGEVDGVVRWGGEEFLIILPRADNALIAALVQRLLVDLAGQPISLRDDNTLQVTASIGALALPQSCEGCNSERAISIVDALMYRAKLRGRNQGWQLLGGEDDDAEQILARLRESALLPVPPTLSLRHHKGPEVSE